MNKQLCGFRQSDHVPESGTKWRIYNEPKTLSEQMAEKLEKLRLQLSEVKNLTAKAEEMITEVEQMQKQSKLEEQKQHEVMREQDKKENKKPIRL